MKKIVFIVLLLGLGYFGGTWAVHSTSGDKFCVSCHAWMDESVKAYHSSPHGGAGKLGFKADCTSCHLPHDEFKVKYIFQKAINGVSEVAYMMTHDADKFDWQANRARRAEFVYDSGCLSCHASFSLAGGEGARQMHALYKQKIDSKDRLSCVSCHKIVGHESLGKILYEKKHPPVGKW